MTALEPNRSLPQIPLVTSRRDDGRSIVYDWNHPEHPVRWRFRKGDNKLLAFVIYEKVAEGNWRAMPIWRGPMPWEGFNE